MSDDEISSIESTSQIGSDGLDVDSDESSNAEEDSTDNSDVDEFGEKIKSVITEVNNNKQKYTGTSHISRISKSVHIIAPEKEANVETKIVISDENIRSSDTLSPFEVAALIKTRIQQIESGSKIFVEITPQLTTPEAIAYAELHSSNFPLMLERRVGPKHVEIVSPNNMFIPKK